MKLINSALLFLTFTFIYSCGHHQDVRPGTQGIHSVIVKASGETEGSREAIEQANHYCEQYDKSAAFLKEDKKYSGDMSEEDYKTAKKVSNVAKSLGGIFGSVSGAGSNTIDSAIGDGYTVSMKFKCQ